MFEYYKGDYFRARQMIWGALSSTYLPDSFRITYEKLLADLDARRAAGEKGHNEADSIKDIAIAKIKTVNYILQKHGPREEEVDEVKTLQDLVEKATRLRDAHARAKKRLYDELMHLCATEINGGVEAKYFAEKAYQELVEKGNVNVRRPSHIRHTSI